jgi:FkbM family methyltransferase
MKNLVMRAKLKLYRSWYKLINHMVIQADYMNCRVLVRAQEDVGIQILAGNFERNDLLYLLSKTRDEDVFLDIGANIGLFSILMARNNSTIKVHAFEPIPLNACLFEASLHLNDIESVKLNRCCVGNSVGDVEFSLATDSAYSSLHDTGRSPELKKIKTSITTLDDYIEGNEIERIDIIKIDVEGAEMLVLEGGREFLSNRRIRPRLVLMELFDENLAIFNTSIAKVLKVMQDLEYNAFVIEGNRRYEYHPGYYNKIYNVFFECEKYDGV